MNRRGEAAKRRVAELLHVPFAGRSSWRVNVHENSSRSMDVFSRPAARADEEFDLQSRPKVNLYEIRSKRSPLQRHRVTRSSPRLGLSIWIRLVDWFALNPGFDLASLDHRVFGARHRSFWPGIEQRDRPSVRQPTVVQCFAAPCYPIFDFQNRFRNFDIVLTLDRMASDWMPSDRPATIFRQPCDHDEFVHGLFPTVQ